MTDTCKTNSCQMNHDGDSTIPEELKKEWSEFIEENCGSKDCPRRYSTRCCVWGKFAEQQ